MQLADTTEGFLYQDKLMEYVFDYYTMTKIGMVVKYKLPNEEMIEKLLPKVRFFCKEIVDGSSLCEKVIDFDIQKRRDFAMEREYLYALLGDNRFNCLADVPLGKSTLYCDECLEKRNKG